MINPFALGHKANHPPFGSGPNVVLVDFDVPRTFFPQAYCHYLPYIEYMPFAVVLRLKR